MSNYSAYIGCSKCTKLLVPAANTDGADRAARAGWILNEDGWVCPTHFAVSIAPPAETAPEKETEKLAA